MLKVYNNYFQIIHIYHKNTNSKFDVLDVKSMVLDYIRLRAVLALTVCFVRVTFKLAAVLLKVI